MLLVTVSLQARLTNVLLDLPPIDRDSCNSYFEHFVSRIVG